MSGEGERIIKQIGSLADRVDANEQEIQKLREELETSLQHQDCLVRELETLIDAIDKISRSPRLKGQADHARETLGAVTGELSK